MVPLIGIIFLIVWWCNRGNTGPNKYGPDPRQAAPEQPNQREWKRRTLYGPNRKLANLGVSGTRAYISSFLSGTSMMVVAGGHNPAMEKVR